MTFEETMEKYGAVKIADNIFRIPFVRKPISCDVLFVKTDSSIWIFDVGLNKKCADAINALEGKKNIVISHFHPDHIMNLCRIKLNEGDSLFVSAYTKKYTLKGTVVTQSVLDFPEEGIRVLQFPSCHARGCLCMTFGDYAFMGDGTYCKEKFGKHLYDANLMAQEIEALEKIPCKFVCLDHDDNFVQSREDLLILHKKIYSRRDKSSPYICVDDFFAEDGSVKQGYEI